MFKIPLSYTPVDIQKLSAVLQQYEGQSHSMMVSDFEKKLSQITGARYVVALNSGTAAIHLGLKILGIKEGDEVMTSTFTFVGSVNPIMYLGAKPVFVDCESDTWNMDPGLLEQGIKSRIAAGVKPKAIVLVHSYGMPAKLNEIQAIAANYEIPLLEDAAEALGSTYHGRHLGVFGEVGVISFNNNKMITTYGGGALLTGNEAIYRKTIFLAEQAREAKPYYEHHEVGHNYRMGSLNAAAGLAQLADFQAILEKRRQINALYKAELQDFGLKFLEENSGSRGNHWLSVAVLNKGRSVETIINRLKEDGIEARFLWKPMHKQSVFESFSYVGNGVSERLFETGFCFPSGNNMIPSQQVEIIEKLKILLRKRTS